MEKGNEKHMKEMKRKSSENVSKKGRKITKNKNKNGLILILH
jgi:hypothetical protein